MVVVVVVLLLLVLLLALTPHHLTLLDKCMWNVGRDDA